MAEENKIENIANSFGNFMSGLGKTEEERDENGNLLSSKTLDGNGNVLYSFAYTYDESGRQTSKTTFDKDGKAEKRVESTYDENGFRTTRRFDKDNELTSETRYDDKGREVASLSYYNGEMRQISSYSYKENGDVDEEIRYEMRNGEMRITEQAFYDDALTRHVRRYGADGSVNLEYQPKGASFPYGVSEPTKNDFARDAERAEENLKNYQAEAAFYNDKPAPVKDAWIASFELKAAEDPVKEEPAKEESVKEAPVQEPAEEVKQAEAEPEKQAETTLENTIQNGDEPKVEENTVQNGDESKAEENTIQNGAEPMTEENTIQNGDEPKAEENSIQNGAEPMAEENTIQNGDEQAEPVRENNANEKQYVDAEGYSHSVRYDDNGRVTADLKYGQDGKLAGQDLYRDGERTGSEEYAYGQDGSTAVYRYDAQGVQTGYDNYDAGGRHVYTSDFRDGNPQTGVVFDEEGRPGTVYRFVQGTNAVSTNISYDGDSVYKTVHSPDGQLLRTETTRDGVLSVVDYVSKTAKMSSFDDEGRIQSEINYAFNDGKLVKTDDVVYSYEKGRDRDGGSSQIISGVQTRSYDGNGRMVAAVKEYPNEGEKVEYAFGENGSYVETDETGKSTEHKPVKLFGKTLYSPDQPLFNDNALDGVPMVGIDAAANPRVDDDVLQRYQADYGSLSQIDSSGMRIDKDVQYSPNNESVSKPVSKPEKQTKRDTEPKDKEENAEQHGEKQTQDDTRSHDEEVLQNDFEDLGWGNADNQTLDAETCAAENADEKTGRGLGESDLMQQNKNLQQWINYFGMEGSRAKPPYASPFEKISGCRDLKGLAMLDLESGNSLINSKSRIELIVRNEDGQKKEPTLEECMTLVRLGQQKGWTSIRISGSAAFQKQMYLACRSLGMPTKDFIPTPEMLKEGDALDAAHNSKDNLLKQSAEDREAGKPEMRLPTLTERCTDLDNRFYALEKVRKAQPARRKTAEDPHPELANFDTIRAAEKQGIRPLNAVEKEPEDVDGKIRVLHKRTNDALNELMESEQKHKGALFNSAAAEQRSEWRKKLIAVQEKEADGQPLTDADKRVQVMANKYKINADPKKEPDKVPPINRKDFDEKTEKALRKKEIAVEAGTAYAAAVVRREAAANAAGLITSGKSDLKTAKDLVNTAKQELKANAANHPPISEVVRQIGQINAQAVSQTAQNKKNYRDVTGHAMPERRANSEASRKLDARVLAASQNRNR